MKIKTSLKVIIDKYSQKYKISANEKLNLFEPLIEIYKVNKEVKKLDLKKCLVEIRKETQKQPNKQKINLIQDTVVEFESDSETTDDESSGNEAPKTPENSKNSDITIPPTKGGNSKNQLENTDSQNENSNKNKRRKNMDPLDLQRTVSSIFGADYDGEPSKLNGIILKLTALKTLLTEDADKTSAVILVKCKLTSKALDVAQSATTLDEISTALKNNCSGENSDDLVVSLNGLKLNGQDSLKEVKELAQKIKRAHLTEGTANNVAERHTMAALRNKFKADFPTNTTITSAMLMNFSTVDEMLKKYEEAQQVSFARVLAVRTRNNGGNNNGYRQELI